jgi:hypothetical protein
MMTKSELIKLCEEKLIDHQQFINAVAPISKEQWAISTQAINQISWFIEKIKNLNEETVKRNKICPVSSQCAITPGGMTCPINVVCPI